MSLSDFIEANLDGLVDDWTEFAGQLMSHSAPLTVDQLQDSARDLLIKIAVDMRLGQNSVEQTAKSHGAEIGDAANVKKTAQAHANDRLDHGFTLNDVVAEFRALRAAVLRSWQPTSMEEPSTAFDDMVRFNEAIDLALTESVRQFSLRVSQTRDRFAGVLAHDLRSPLGAIANSTEFLLRDETLSAPSLKAVANIQRSAVRMRRMVDDLLDFARTRLGDILPVSVSPQDIGRLCSNACNEVTASFPHASIAMRFEGDLSGDWDGDRISQLIINLLVNAIQHGDGAIHLFARDAGESILLSVSNEGKPITEAALANIFDPLTRTYSSPERRGTAAGVGLGLYICKCIAQAHRGSISVASAGSPTVFAVMLPRYAAI